MTTEPSVTESCQPAEKTQSVLRGFGRSAGVKFFILGFLALLAYIPLQMVWNLQGERVSTAREAREDIERMAGGRQMINGPFIAVPYLTTTSNGYHERHMAVFFADEVTADNKVTTEMRYRSVFQVPVYRDVVALKAHFKPIDMTQLKWDHVEPLWDEASLFVEVSGTRGIVSRVIADCGQGKTTEFEPGTPTRLGSGIQASLKGIDIQKSLDISFTMQINGSSSLGLAMLGKTSLITMSSPWPHPSFQGQFLPEQRDVNDVGFTATWRSSPLARSIPTFISLDSDSDGTYSRNHQLITNLVDNSRIGVGFYVPADLYQRVERALKYGLLFIGGMFLAVFSLEMTSTGRLHAAQYVLFGLALILFYVLLLSFAEHIGFNAAYVVAATATSILTASYVGMALRDRLRGIAFAVILAIAYGVIFMLLSAEDYGLLIGSVAVFTALTALMFTTLRLDWSFIGVKA